MKKMIYLALLLVLAGGCKKDKKTATNAYGFGWKGSDNTSAIPQSINTTNFTTQTYPASMDLTPKFPPVGNQGQYGTCVAWSTAYAIKTTIDGMDRGLNPTQLADAANQFSPKDLFTAVADNLKGANCDGTNFTDALDVVLNRGVATLQTVPYTGLSDCSQAGVQSSWTSEANQHKIKNYRRINLTVSEIKSYLSNNQPVLFGAKLSDNFMQWNSDDVISSNTTFDQVGQHAYHAMALAGYDDAKGPNGAFKVQNSWGTNWGSSGRIWVDYNFFINEFCYGGNVFIATNGNTNPNPPTPDPVQNGYVDLTPWAFADFNTFNSSFPTQRFIEFNVYNVGDQIAHSSTGWALYYLYYNAYNANDYGFLIVDEADASIAVGSQYTDVNNYVHFNSDISAGGSLGMDMFGSDTISQYYYVPNITGEYYLMLYADPLDVIQENDESNNYFYTTNQYPISFSNGVGKNNKPVIPIANYGFSNAQLPVRENLAHSSYVSAVNSTYPNAYSAKEIRQLVKAEKQSGRWQTKLNEFLANQSNQNPGANKMRRQ